MVLSSLRPEEGVRQGLIHQMVEILGYPRQSLAVEKSLNQLPHLKGRSDLPDCRLDLVCFAKDIHPHHPIYPLLIVECKAIPLKDKTLWQASGYNFYVRAPFIALVNQYEIQTGWMVGDGYQFIAGLPCYEDLLHNISKT